MANRIGTGDPRGINKGHSSKFHEGSQVQQIPEESRTTYRPKHCGNNDKDADNSPKTLNDKNYVIISAVNDFFYQLDPNTATLMEEVFGLQGSVCYVEKLRFDHIP